MIKPNTRKFFLPFNIFFLLGVLAIPAVAQKQPSDTDLVKQTQNPVADLISVPLQNNFNFGTGSKNRTVWVGNLQPVIPIHITDDWNLITRTIVPIINQPFEGHQIAKLPINTQLQTFGNVAKPEFGSDWQLRFQVQLLFPK